MKEIYYFDILFTVIPKIDESLRKYLDRREINRKINTQCSFSKLIKIFNYINFII